MYQLTYRKHASRQNYQGAPRQYALTGAVLMLRMPAQIDGCGDTEAA